MFVFWSLTVRDEGVAIKTHKCPGTHPFPGRFRFTLVNLLRGPETKCTVESRDAWYCSPITAGFLWPIPITLLIIFNVCILKRRCSVCTAERKIHYSTALMSLLVFYLDFVPPL